MNKQSEKIQGWIFYMRDCLESHTDLLESAEILYNHKKYSVGTSLAVLALEELGKYWVCDDVLSGKIHFKDISEFKKYVEGGGAHDRKINRVEAQMMEKYNADEKLGMTPLLNKAKQHFLYADNKDFGGPQKEIKNKFGEENLKGFIEILEKQKIDAVTSMKKHIENNFDVVGKK